MKILILYADGFEDVEAIAPADVLTRGGEEVTCVSIMGRREVKAKSGNVWTVPTLIEDCDYSKYDALVIPGGPASFKVMPSIPIVEKLIRLFSDSEKLVASICAAPHLVGKLGYFKNRSFTVHPGFEDKIIGGEYKRECGVVTDGNFITAKSMYYSIPFALEIYSYFHGKEAARKLELSCQGEK